MADRISHLSARLVTASGCTDFSRSAATHHQRRGPVSNLLDDFNRHLTQADLIIGHNVHRSLTTLRFVAKQHDHYDLVAKLSYPQFGLDGGRRAAICIRQLADEYLIFNQKTPTCNCAGLTDIYQQIFRQQTPEISVSSPGALAHQLYLFLNAYQRENSLVFLSDVLCLED